MRLKAIGLVILGVTGLASCGSSGGGTASPNVTMDEAMELDLAGPLRGTSTTGTPEVSPRDADFAGLINGIRRNDGSGVVSYDARLNRAAQGHADDMVANGYFSHISQGGSTVEDRIRAQGYAPVAWGENIAAGYSTNDAVLKAWQNSPEHNRLLIADSVDEFGLGVAGSGAGTRWVLVMAAD